MDALTGDAARADRLALVRLMAVPRVGRLRLKRAVASAGSAGALLELPPRERARRLGVSRAVLPPPDDARARLDGWEEAGVRVLGWSEEGYPPRLLHLADPPPLLFVRGDPARLGGVQVAVVGSRSATAYGRRVARHIGGELARGGVTVLSGMARGIDGEAHRGALEAGGPSTAFLGAGPERAHPRSNLGIYRALVRTGCVASEYPPGTEVRARHFPERNRLLAALARAVVVVEAARRSGALITAGEAADLGRDVWAVPGPVDSRTSRGTNELIGEGCRQLLDTSFLLKALRARSHRPEPLSDPPPALGMDAGVVWTALELRPRPVDELARAAGMDPRRVLAALTRLEVGGWAYQHAGLRFRRAS